MKACPKTGQRVDPGSGYFERGGLASHVCNSKIRKTQTISPVSSMGGKEPRETQLLSSSYPGTPKNLYKNDMLLKIINWRRVPRHFSEFQGSESNGTERTEVEPTWGQLVLEGWSRIPHSWPWLECGHIAMVCTSIAGKSFPRAEERVVNTPKTNKVEILDDEHRRSNRSPTRRKLLT